MQNFADQCLDMARSMLGHNLSAIEEDGTIQPVEGESSRADEPGHAALAIGEFYRATQEATLEGHDLVDLSARCVTAQAFTEEEHENGLAYSALGLLSFGPSKERNVVWERLLEPTQERLDKRLLARSDYEDHKQAFNIAKAVTRYSMGLSKKDETSRLIDRFVERIGKYSSAGFCDDGPDKGIGGAFDIYGVLAFVFIRQALQLHANVHLRDRKLPSLRTFGEKYLKLIPDIVRQDGLGWIYGRGIGAYGQMHLISIILQGMRDGWVPSDRMPEYQDILRRLFQFFFLTYMDQDHGLLVIRDAERTTIGAHTTRMANFDGARYLSQWSRLARAIGTSMQPKAAQPRSGGRFVVFDKAGKKEQGLFVYQDPGSGMHVQLPLLSSSSEEPTSDSLAFPHMPGIFDYPANRFLPIMVPELVFDGKSTVPCFYGKRTRSGLGLRKSLYLQYEQPELISNQGVIINGIGSVKVKWTFAGSKITSEFVYTVKNQVKMDRMRYMMVIAAPHSHYRVGHTFALGQGGLNCQVEHDDFQAVWLDTEVVTNEPDYKTYYGNIHYVQTLTRDHALNMRPGQQYKLIVSYEPDIGFAEE